MYAKIYMLTTLVAIGFLVTVVSTPVPSDSKSTTISSVTKKDAAEMSKLVDDDVDSLADASVDYEESDLYYGQDNYGQAQLPSSPIAASTSSEPQDHSIELESGSQTFFPAFANLFQPRQPHGHSRPQISYNQEGAYSQRPNALRNLLNYQAPSYNGFRSSDYGKAIAASDANGLLGSGNFGVIRGGTFFAESADTESQFSDSFDSPYYNSNNGHGRPTYFFGNNNPRPNYNQDQFANFRDFADINAPSNSAFSHFVVVYANKNGTISDAHNIELSNDFQQHLSVSPKNIIERLAQIEKEQHTALPAEEPVKKDKTSKGKVKLALLNDKKKSKITKKMLSKSDAKDKSDIDPLLALS